MSQSISLWGASYSNVPGIELPKTGGGTALFTDVTPTTASISDVAEGKIFFDSAGVQQTGIASGGGEISVVETPDAHGGTIVEITAEEVHLGTKSITVNGTYDAEDEDLTGYSSVTVNVPTGTARSSSDLTVSGATVTAPAGLYSSAASKSVASGTAGTPTATKGTVNNHSVSVTPSVTNTTGYITGSTKTGTAVTVSASELVSGSETKTANGTYDVTNLASLVVAVPIVTYYTGSSAPSSSLGSNGDIYLKTS